MDPSVLHASFLNIQVTASGVTLVLPSSRRTIPDTLLIPVTGVPVEKVRVLGVLIAKGGANVVLARNANTVVDMVTLVTLAGFSHSSALGATAKDTLLRDASSARTVATGSDVVSNTSVSATSGATSAPHDSRRNRRMRGKKFSDMLPLPALRSRS